MAKSKVQFVDSLIAELTKLSMTDDNALFSAKEFISDKLDGYRATVLRKYIADKKNDLSACYQKIDCLDAKSLGVTCEIEGITIESKTDIMVVEIPELLSVHKAVKYFGTFDLKRNYQKTTLGSLSSTFDRWGRPLSM